MIGITQSNLFLLKHFNGQFPVAVEKMMYYEGILIEEFSDESNIIALINPNINLIKISSKLPDNIRSFVLSYCIGNLLIENKQKEITLKMLSHSKVNKLHNESLIFAFNLTMPEAYFRKYCRAKNKDIGKISLYFNVSNYLINTRITQLKID